MTEVDDEFEETIAGHFDDELPIIPGAAEAFDIDEFWAFCADLEINSKEDGIISLSRDQLLGSQRYVVEQIADGFARGIHSFIILKARQMGITTITLALDLYWIMKNRGMVGSMVCHEDEARDFFKSTLDEYIAGLPIRWKMPIKAHNRTTLAIAHDDQVSSRLAYQVAGTTKRNRGKLGRGKGLTFLHATECSSWGDEEGLASLQASLAQRHPKRLFVYESTARGYANPFYDMWETAKESTQQRAIFVGWWLNQKYRVSRVPGTTHQERESHNIYRVYWDEAAGLTAEEQKWVDEVRDLYGYEIDDEQIAWHRYTKAEIIKDDTMMMQEYPPTETYAFVMTGSQFFNSARLNDEFKIAKTLPFSSWRFTFSADFMNTELLPCPAKLAQLRIWQEPHPGAAYVLGADPAWGSSEWADRSCVSVWRCYEDGMDQVAEFCTPELPTFEFAWVICYLCGAYGHGGNNLAMLNLELNGPGQAVLTEMDRLKRDAARAQGSGGLIDVVRVIQHYLYRRIDNLGGMPSAFHTKTNADVKERMLNFFKDCFERGASKAVSPWLIDEMRNVERVEGFLGAPGRGKDDRVIASALAHIAWVDYVRPQCIRRGISRQSASAEPARGVNPIFTTAHYLKKLGVTA